MRQLALPLPVISFTWFLGRLVEVRGFAATATFTVRTVHCRMPRLTRQSIRLRKLSSTSSESSSVPFEPSPKKLERAKSIKTKTALTKRAKRKDDSDPEEVTSYETASTTESTTASSSSDTEIRCLSRTRETSILKNPQYTHVLGIDEAGRGPLAGPVVAAAAYAPIDISGIVDSKQITKEDERERLYHEITNNGMIQWAVAVVSAARIDEINILQATLEAMTMAASALVMEAPKNLKETASIEHEGCYVVRSPTNTRNEPRCQATLPLSLASTFALIDGNQLPPNMPVPAETIIKGDSKEYCIAAASILAKVTRDRLMNAYALQHPEYNFQQHKGYPTKAHKDAITKHGATAIHRRTFAPLKYMDLS